MSPAAHEIVLRYEAQGLHGDALRERLRRHARTVSALEPVLSVELMSGKLKPAVKVCACGRAFRRAEEGRKCGRCANREKRFAKWP